MKRLALMFLLLPVTCFAFAPAGVLFFFATNQSGINAGAATTYLPIQGSGTSSTTEQDSILYIPPGLATDLYCRLGDAASSDLTITFRNGAADTALTCTIVTPNQSCTDVAHPVVVGSDPRVSYKLAYAGSGESHQIGCRMYFKRA